MIDYLTCLGYGWKIPSADVERLRENDPYLFEELWVDNDILFSLNTMSADSDWMICTPDNMISIPTQDDFCMTFSSFKDGLLKDGFAIKYTGEELELLKKAKEAFPEAMAEPEKEYIFTQVF